MKIIKKFLLSVVIISFSLFIASIIFAVFYEDEVTNFLIKEINKHLNTEIDVEEVNFSVLKKFPNASLEFKNIIAKSTFSFNQRDFGSINTDTLFTAKSLFLKFNIIDIFKKNYKIKTIQADKGEVKLFIDKKGNNNYQFWEESNDSLNSYFQLHNLIFSDFKILFVNELRKFILKTSLNQARLNGNFSFEEFSLGTNATMFVNELVFDDVTYIKSQDVVLEIDLNVNKGRYHIQKGKLEIAKLKFDLEGEFNAGETNNIDIILKGKDLGIRSLFSFLPEKYQKSFNLYASSGVFYFDVKITGQINKVKTPHIEAKFGISNGEIRKKNSNIKFTKLYCKGFYSNGKQNNSKTSVIKLDHFETFFGKSFISGKYIIQNFSYPEVELITNANIYLSELQEFIKLDTIENINGKLEADLKMNGKIANYNKITRKDIRNLNTKGKVIFQGVTLNLKKQQHEYSNINAWLTINKDIKIDSLSLKIRGNDFYLEGKIVNAFNYLIDDKQTLWLEGNIYSSLINADNYFNISANKSDTGSFGKLIFPENINLDLRLNIDSFVFQKLRAKDIKGYLSYKPRMFVLKSVSFNSMKGKITGGGVIIQKYNNDFVVRSQSVLTNIDIQKLFYSFNDFGQDFIIGRHLKGSLTGYLNFSSEMGSNFSVKPEKIIAASSFEIVNGELVNFEPMLGLSRFIKVSELKHIKFSTLENEIFINDQKITIPQMAINSSALNFSGSGVHYFNNDYTYKTKVLLSDILAVKAKKAKKENTEFGVIEDDGLGKTSLYLSISGNGYDYKVSYDSKKVKNVIKQSFGEQKLELKAILNEEFGWFKNDTLKGFPNIGFSDSNFIIVWDEEDQFEDTIVRKNTKKHDTISQHFIIEWDEDEKEKIDSSKRKKKKVFIY